MGTAFRMPARVRRGLPFACTWESGVPLGGEVVGAVRTGVETNGVDPEEVAMARVGVEARVVEGVATVVMETDLRRVRRSKESCTAKNPFAIHKTWNR